MEIINQARVEYRYRFSSLAPIITKTLLSNNTITYIINDVLKVNKKVDKLLASPFDILDFTITISNVSNTIVNNIYFKDALPSNLKYVSNSLKINGYDIPCAKVENLCYLGSLESSENIVINFNTVILPSSNINSTSNVSTIYFDYIYNILKPPTVIALDSNSTSTNIENNLFKQFNVSHVLIFPDSLPKVDKIISIKCKINLLKKKLVATPHCNTLSHKDKNLLNLILIGSLKYDVTYYSKNCISNCCKDSCKKYLHAASFINGFSTNLLVPCGINIVDVKAVPIKITGEKISYNLINTQTIYMNSDLLLEI